MYTYTCVYIYIYIYINTISQVSPHYCLQNIRDIHVDNNFWIALLFCHNMIKNAEISIYIFGQQWTSGDIVSITFHYNNHLIMCIKYLCVKM